MSSDTPRGERIELLNEELADLDQQVADGDLDEATAERLASRYRAELSALGPDAVGVGPDEPEPGPGDTRAGRRVSGRVLWGMAIVGLAVVAITAFAVTTLDRRDSAGAEGVVDDVLGADGDVDLGSVTNEQMEEVVARNPDVIGMRLALARRYFEAGEFDKALDHYFEVLDREENPEALANIGWMTYLSDRPDVAVGYLEAALQRQPDYLPAQWFIANVYVTLGRPAEAVPYLVGLIDDDTVPDDIKENATTLLRQIEDGT